ncbi:MAG: acyl-CoA thioesterase [Anaerolineae bacterium]|jgi:acyl-CoA thioester hydrolase|nr:acyl-CoA thioesterase [Anaerolineae bacterium]MBT7070563.1 acyl-CoA thioesterase [Anaerolineae bacterium]MBT7324894.1 acyl-CoA thioesterase [Anaerolineae bacterium]
MTELFTRTFRVRWSEDNALGQLDLAGYFRYVIETAWEWGASNGLGIVESEQLGLAWVIRETEIRVFTPLYPNMNFDFTIWLVKWRRVRGTRCFEIRFKESGEIVAQGTQQIVSLDSRTLRPTPPPVHIMDNFLIENPRIFEQGQLPKLGIQNDAAFIVQRDVEWRDLDSLEHVNNATYAAFAEDAAVQALADVGWSPLQLKTQNLAVIINRVHIKYHFPAIWRDTLDVVTSLVELDAAGGKWYIDIKRTSDGEQILQCVLEWSIADRHTGKEQNLPKSLFQALKKKIDVT